VFLFRSASLGYTPLVIANMHGRVAISVQSPATGKSEALMIAISAGSAATLAFLAAGILPAAAFPAAGAHQAGGGNSSIELVGHRGECFCRPYWIEEVYDAHSDRHIAHMRYAPGYHPSVDRYYYWYNRPYTYVSRPRASHSKHVAWCRARYKTYDAKTDTFVGKGMKKYRCNSPYDGRR
jgi:BA14K-like protein